MQLVGCVVRTEIVAAKRVGRSHPTLSAAWLLLSGRGVLLAALWVMGCRSTPVSQPAPMEATLRADQRTVWAALIGAFVEQDLPFREINQREGTLVAEPRVVDSAFLAFARCPGSPASRTMPTHARVEAKLSPDGPHSRLSVKALFTIAIDSGRTQTCQSTGELERRLMYRVANQAGLSTPSETPADWNSPTDLVRVVTR